MEHKSGFVALLGRTNVGKSTLVNNLVGEKVAITTRKPQTTRTAIKAIINKENAQIILTDTPGIHKPKNKLGQTMVDTSYASASDVDVVVFLIEATEQGVGKGDALIVEKIKEIKKPTILVINKIDLIKKEEVLLVIEQYKELYNFSSIIPVSAQTGEGTEMVIEEIIKLLPKGPKYFSEDEYTDQTTRQMIEEIIREKALKLLDQEIPHGIYVEIETMGKKKTKEQEDYYNIEATIYCSRESHKPIVIGKKGDMLKKIGTYARQDSEELLGVKVNLKLWVKVKENWQDSDLTLNKFKNQ